MQTGKPYMTDLRIDRTLENVEKEFLTLGSLVENILSQISELIKKRKFAPDSLELVLDCEKKINNQDRRLLKVCTESLAKESPFGMDLRFIIAVMKLSADLERMGDQSRNIAYLIKDYLNHTTTKVDQDIIEMCNQVQWMVRTSIEAFMKRDVLLAERVRENDQIVDDILADMRSKCTDMMKQDTQLVETGIDQIMMAKNFERIADHATNVAEEVFFVVRGHQSFDSYKGDNL